MGRGAFNWDFNTNLAPQFRAFSRALKIEKLKASLFSGLEGRGIQVTGALYLGLFVSLVCDASLFCDSVQI